MKILQCVIVLALLSLGHISTAQTCTDGFYISNKGAKLTFESYDSQGKLEMTQTQTMKSYAGTPSGFNAVMTANLIDKKGKTIVENRDFSVKCEDGTFIMDLSSLYLGQAKLPAGMEAEVTGSGVSYPINMAVGQSLPNGETEIKMKSGGSSLMNFRFNEMNRKVEKKESITTPAGTFECLKLVSDTEVKILMKRTARTAVWIAKGVGIVRTETYNKKGDVESSMVLTKLEK